MSIYYFDESWTMPPGLPHRDFPPDALDCLCPDCLYAQAQDDADEAQAWAQDEAVTG